jgi:PAS domain S-box-containing protein
MRETRPAIVVKPPELLATIDFNGCLEPLNPAWSEVVGLGGDELVGALFLDVVHPDDVERVRARMRAAAADGQPIALEARCRRRGGGYVNVLWSFAPRRGQRLFDVSARPA